MLMYTHKTTKKQAGLWGALLNICGLLGSTVTAVVLDHTKKFQELAVINMAISILFLVLFFEVSICVNCDLEYIVSSVLLQQFSHSLVRVIGLEQGWRYCFQWH